jgi:hypothetical protein
MPKIGSFSEWFGIGSPSPERESQKLLAANVAPGTGSHDRSVVAILDKYKARLPK